MLCEARILVCVGDDEEFALANGMAAEKVRIRYLAKVDAVRRFEEQAVRVHQAHQRYRRFTDGRREAGQIVEAGLAAGFEHAIAAQGRKARALLRAGSETARLGHGAWAFDLQPRFDSCNPPGDVNLLLASRRVKPRGEIRAHRENRNRLHEVFRSRTLASSAE